MTRMIEDATSFREQMIEGFVAANGRHVRRIPGASGVMAVGSPRRGKVSLLIGGGSGHYPAFCGTVGEGLADGAVIGDVFTSPSGEQVYRCTKALDGGAGVLYSYGNYSGDVLNFGAAEARCRAEGMDVRTVIVTDDVASAPKGSEGERRGIAGDTYVFKVAGASAARGDGMDAVEEAARRANANTRTIGVAFAGCTLPGQTEPLFTVEPGTMEIGMGVHGEPGIRTSELLPAGGIAELLVDTVLDDAPAGAGSRAAVMLNGLGNTKYEELFVLYGHVSRLLAGRGVEAHAPEVGELVTSLDMAGCSLTLMWLDDDLEALHDAPASTPAYTRGGAVAQAGTPLADGDGKADPALASAAVAEAVSGDAAELSESGGVAVDALARALEALSETEQELGGLDAAAGDGDHGAGMVRGMTAAVEAAHSGGGTATEVLLRAGSAFSEAAGGASGALYGACVTAFGGALGDGEPDADRVLGGLKAALDTVKQVGGAEAGDKTLIDALEPFVRGFGEAAREGLGVTEAWNAALPAAEAGAEATADMVSRKGRSSKLGERSRGHKDPGAASMHLILRAAGEALSQAR